MMGNGGFRRIPRLGFALFLLPVARAGVVHSGFAAVLPPPDSVTYPSPAVTSAPASFGSKVDASPASQEFSFETYRQEFVVTFATEADARAAVITPTPLWNNRDWAVSGRWDDLNPNNARMREVLTRHGHRATFYLNSWFSDWADMPASPHLPEARDLLQGGHSVGGHSMTHPWLSYCHRNRIFEETAGIRILWEAATDSPVVSYAFSYSNFRNEDEGDPVQADIIRLLQRAGFYHVANEPTFDALGSDLILSPILPSDGVPITAVAEARLADPEFKKAHPILTYAMHARYQSPSEWAGFEQTLDQYGHRPNWWYCNQNEYAAYRYQFQHSRILQDAIAADSSLASARTRRLTLERPVLLDLNDSIPLTFRIDGVLPTSVMDVSCSTARCALPDSPTTPFHFDLHHDYDQMLPAKIGLVPPNTHNRSQLTPQDSDADLPGIRALLFLDGKVLNLVLENQLAKPLSDCRITYRLPLAWADGTTRRHLPDLAPHSQTSDRWTPRLLDRHYKTAAGSAFLVAQIDARLDGRAVRLHAVCHASLTSEDRSFPQGAFLRIGPLPIDQLDLDRLGADLGSLIAGFQPWQIDDGSVFHWESLDGPSVPPHFEVERVRLTGAWTGWDLVGFYVIRSRIHSRLPQAARLQRTAGFVNRVILNGADVTRDDVIHLAEGTNSLAMVCASFPSVFLRFTDATTGERLSHLAFERPLPGAPQSMPYAVPPRPDTEPMELWPARLPDGRMLIRWSTQGILQSAPSPAGPWSDTPSVRRAITVSAGESNRFFRLRSR